jgi:hypothetical protein
MGIGNIFNNKSKTVQLTITVDVNPADRSPDDIAADISKILGNMDAHDIRRLAALAGEPFKRNIVLKKLKEEYP